MPKIIIATNEGNVLIIKLYQRNFSDFEIRRPTNALRIKNGIKDSYDSDDNNNRVVINIYLPFIFFVPKNNAIAQKNPARFPFMQLARNTVDEAQG